MTTGGGGWPILWLKKRGACTASCFTLTNTSSEVESAMLVTTKEKMTAKGVLAGMLLLLLLYATSETSTRKM
jgi:hypothetical protein